MLDRAALDRLVDGADVVVHLAFAIMGGAEETRLSARMPAPVLRALEFMPALKPVIPDPGVEFQLVHHDDVASALRAAVLGRGRPGIYNLGAPETLTVSDVADALGWYSIPLPELGAGARSTTPARRSPRWLAPRARSD